MREGIKDRVKKIKKMRNIIGIEDWRLSRIIKKGKENNEDINKSNEKNGWDEEMRWGKRVLGKGLKMERKIRKKMFRKENREKKRKKEEMRDEEGIVKINVEEVREDIGRKRKKEKRIEVREVEIEMEEIVMKNIEEGFDELIEKEIGGRIGNNEGGEIIEMILRIGIEIINIDVEIREEIEEEEDNERNGGDGRIGEMRRGRDKEDVEMEMKKRMMIVEDGNKEGILKMNKGIWMKWKERKKGDLEKKWLKIGSNFRIKMKMIGRRKRMKVWKSIKDKRNNLWRRIEINSEGKKRDNREVERKIIVGKKKKEENNIGLGKMWME